MKNRPILNIQKTNTYNVIEFLNILLLFGLWFLVIKNYEFIPNNIATHYSGTTPDKFNHKSSIYIILIVVTILYIVLTILTKYLHKLNYPKEVTLTNARELYQIGLGMLIVLRFSVTVIFGIGILKTIYPKLISNQHLPVLTLACVFGLILAPMIYFINKMSAIKS